MKNHLGRNAQALLSPFESLTRNRELINQMTKREIVNKHKGSFLELLWMVLNPLLMLTVYTIVFSVVFKSRWGVSTGETRSDFAAVLFAGLIVFNLFSETISRAPKLIVDNPNFVKKVVFPLEALTWVSLFSSLVNSAIGLVLLYGFIIITKHTFYLSWLLVPIALLPLIMAMAGMSWFLSSLGVFVRDTSQIINVLLSILMFMSPIFFPLSALPIGVRAISSLSPVAYYIESVRTLIFRGNSISLGPYLLNLLLGLSWFVFGYFWFKKTRKAFADVI